MTLSDAQIQKMTGPEMYRESQRIVMSPDSSFEELHVALVMAKLAEISLAVDPVDNYPVDHPYARAWKEAVHGK